MNRFSVFTHAMLYLRVKGYTNMHFCQHTQHADWDKMYYLVMPWWHISSWVLHGLLSVDDSITREIPWECPILLNQNHYQILKLGDSYVIQIFVQSMNQIYSMQGWWLYQARVQICSTCNGVSALNIQSHTDTLQGAVAILHFFQWTQHTSYLHIAVMQCEYISTRLSVYKTFLMQSK